MAEIPGITRITAQSTRNILPGLALVVVLIAGSALLRALRPRRFAVTRDFVDGMIESESVPRMTGRRMRFVVTETEHEHYVDLIRCGVDLGALLHAEHHSAADAQVIRARFALTPDLAATLALARRVRILCTEDLGTARLAVALGIDVYDRAAWIERWAADPTEPAEGRAARKMRRSSGRAGHR